MNQEQIYGIIRHTLTFIGGILVTKGTISQEQSTILVGSLSTIIPVIWSIVIKNKAGK